MILVKVAGGLGNQMQQYAMYRKLLSIGREAKLDLSWFSPERQKAALLAPRELELAYFRDLPMDVCTDGERARLTGGSGLAGKLRRRLFGSRTYTESQMYHPEFLMLTDGVLEGYFAAEKYYADILPELRGLFVFPESADPDVRRANAAAAAAMAVPGEVSVSVHIRRGDYLDAENAQLFGGICTPAYYEGAAEAVRTLLPSGERELPRHFFLFSDDPAYARTLHFGAPEEENTVIDVNRGRDSLLDMQLMSRCRCHICANSTFSFWGARLDPRPDRAAVRPTVHKTTQVFDPALMHDLWPGWGLVDNRGQMQ